MDHGSCQITRLEARFASPTDKPNASVVFLFQNVDAVDESNRRPISYSVRADSRDWVFVTSSLIEERINKIKRPRIRRYVWSGSARSIVIFVSLYAAMFSGFPSFEFGPYRWDFSDPAPKSEQALSDNLVKAKDEGKVENALDALILLEQLREANQAEYKERQKTWEAKADEWVKQQKEKQTPAIPIWLWFVIIAAAPITLLFGISLFLKRYYLIYNFCWGDYAEIFRRKEMVRKFVLGVIVVGIVVSFIGGLLARLVRM